MKLTLRRLDLAIEQVLADATGEAEEHAAFAEALQRHVKTPCNALVLGAEVILKGFDYNGNERRGVTAKCIGVDGRKYQIAAADVELPHSGVGQDYLAFTAGGWV